MYRLFGSILLLAVVSVGAGCSGKPTPPSYGSEDGRAIAILVEDVNEKKSNTLELKPLFEGNPPAIRELSKFSYEVTGSPTVSGSTATSQVKILHEGTGDEIAKVEWSFTKAGDKWKVKSAPLK